MGSSIIGTQGAIQAKSLSQLLAVTFAGNDQFREPFTWVIFSVWALTTVFWVIAMNRGLAQYDARLIIPLLQAFWTFFSIVGGGIYFQEFRRLSPRFVGFCAGLMFVLAGVALLVNAQGYEDELKNFKQLKQTIKSAENETNSQAEECDQLLNTSEEKSEMGS